VDFITAEAERCSTFRLPHNAEAIDVVDDQDGAAPLRQMVSPPAISRFKLQLVIVADVAPIWHALLPTAALSRQLLISQASQPSPR